MPHSLTMDAIALSLIIAGALLHATWNLLAKKASGGAAFVWLAGCITSISALPCAFFTWLYYAPNLTWLSGLVIAGSALIHLLYALTLQTGYQRSEFSVVYPLARGTGPLFSVLAAIILLDERPGLFAMLAICCILAGILLISDGWRSCTKLWQKPMSATDENSVSQTRTYAGLVWGCLTGITIAAYTVVDAWAIRQLGLPPLLYYALSLPLRSLLLAPKALAQPRLLQQQWRSNRSYIIGVGLLSPLAYLLALFALQRAPLYYIAPSRELSMLAGLLIAAYFLGERLTLSRLLGVSFMVSGVCLLASR